MTEHPLTRSTDCPDNAKRIRNIRGQARWRTIFYSIVASGLVTLAINATFERSRDNQSADLAQENCSLIQDVSRQLADISRDVSEESQDQDSRKRWAGYEAIFRGAFPPESKSCEEFFPKRSPLPFIE